MARTEIKIDKGPHTSMYCKITVTALSAASKVALVVRRDGSSTMDFNKIENATNGAHTFEVRSLHGGTKYVYNASYFLGSDQLWKYGTGDTLPSFTTNAKLSTWSWGNAGWDSGRMSITASKFNAFLTKINKVRSELGYDAYDFNGSWNGDGVGDKPMYAFQWNAAMSALQTIAENAKYLKVNSGDPVQAYVFRTAAEYLNDMIQ